MNRGALAVAAITWAVLALPVVVVVSALAVVACGWAGLAVPVLGIAALAAAVRSVLPRGGRR